MSHACKVIGYSRDTYCRYRQAVDEGGVEALIEQPHRKPNLRNVTAPEIAAAIVDLAFEQPAFGHVRVNNELRKQGRIVSPPGRGVWLCHGLQTFTQATKAKRTQPGRALSESVLNFRSY